MKAYIRKGLCDGGIERYENEDDVYLMLSELGIPIYKETRDVFFIQYNEVQDIPCNQFYDYYIILTPDVLFTLTMLDKDITLRFD